MNEINLNYFLRRMCDEQEAAAEAACPEAAAAHAALAERYRIVLAAFDHPSLRGDGDPCESVAA